MPTIGTNYALNPHFTNPDPPTLGWTKYRIDGYPYHYVEFFGGPRWGCAPDNWCNTIGVETVGGSNRLDSTTNDVPGFVPTLIDSVTISQFIDWEPTITNWARTESTPGASAFCGCNYTHGGQGFPMAPGEIWRLRFTVKLLSPAPSHRIRGRIGWGSRAIANDPVWGLGCSQFSPVTFFGQGVYPHVYFDQFFDGDPDVDWDTVGEEHTIDCLFTVDNFWFGGATIAGIEYLNYWTPVLDTTTARFDLSIGFECLPFTYVGDGIKFAILDPFELIYEGSLTVPPNYPGGPVADEPPDVTPPTPEPIVVDHEGLALCGEFEGEVLMDGTDYVGVYGFNTGMAADLWNDYCEGGLTWLYSNWWLAPCHHGAVCPDWPINLFASFLPGVYPAITYDTTGPPGWRTHRRSRSPGQG